MIYVYEKIKPGLAAEPAPLRRRGEDRERTSDMQPFLHRYLGDKPFWRVTMRLALPIALQNLLISSFTLVDTVMIGGLGDVALSAVGMAGQWSWMLTLVLFGFCSGTAVFISQYWGVKDIKGIKNVYGLMLVNTMAASAVFFIVGFLFSEGIGMIIIIMDIIIRGSTLVCTIDVGLE